MTARGSARAVRAEDVGAWLVKASPGASDVETMRAQGFAEVRRWCVRRSYRTELVVPGAPVLLWVSGGSARVPSGVHAVGEVTGPVERDLHPGPVDDLPMRLRPLDPPVLRPVLLAHPVLSGLEVLRSPWGSNPSYLDRDQLAALREVVGPGQLPATSGG